METWSHPHFHFDRYKHMYALKPTHTHTLWHTYKDMLDPPACLCAHAIVFIRGYWLAGQIFQPLAGELSNEADHFQQALGPPPPKWRPHFCSSLNCLSVSAVEREAQSVRARLDLGALQRRVGSGAHILSVTDITTRMENDFKLRVLGSTALKPFSHSWEQDTRKVTTSCLSVKPLHVENRFNSYQHKAPTHQTILYKSWGNLMGYQQLVIFSSIMD